MLVKRTSEAFDHFDNAELTRRNRTQARERGGSGIRHRRGFAQRRDRRADDGKIGAVFASGLLGRLGDLVKLGHVLNPNRVAPGQFGKVRQI